MFFPVPPHPDSGAGADRPAEAPGAGPAPPGVPPVARLAGITWVVVGLLVALGSGAGGVALVVLRAQQPDPAPQNPAEGPTAAAGVALGAAFAVAGARVARGTAAGTLVTSTLSLLAGSGCVWAAVAALSLSRPAPIAAADGASRVLLEAVAIVLGVVAGGFLVPAGLGFVGYRGYRRWREADVPPRWPPAGRRDPPAPASAYLEAQLAPLLGQLSAAVAAAVPAGWAAAVLRVEATPHGGGVTGMRYLIRSEGRRQDEVGPTAAVAAAARAVWQECEQAGNGWSAMTFRMERAGGGWRYTVGFE